MYTITLLDAETKQTRTLYFKGSWKASDLNEYFWSEGNYSCDCHRAEYFGIDNHPCGDSRFVVMCVVENGVEVYAEEVPNEESQPS